MIKKSILTNLIDMTQLAAIAPSFHFLGSEGRLVIKAENWDIVIPYEETEVGDKTDVTVNYHEIKKILREYAPTKKISGVSAKVYIIGDDMFVTNGKTTESCQFTQMDDMVKVFVAGNKVDEVLFELKVDGKIEYQDSVANTVGDEVLKMKVNLKNNLDLTKTHIFVRDGKVTVSSNNGFIGQSVDVLHGDVKSEITFSIDTSINRMITEMFIINKKESFTMFRDGNYIVMNHGSDIAGGMKLIFTPTILNFDDVKVALYASLDGLDAEDQIFINIEQAEILGSTDITEFFKNGSLSKEFSSVIFENGVIKRMKKDREVIKRKLDDGTQEIVGVEEHREELFKYEHNGNQHLHVIPLFWLKRFIKNSGEVILDSYYTEDKIILVNRDQPDIKVWRKQSKK